jgi:hypothetical protein
MYMLIIKGFTYRLKKLKVRNHTKLFKQFQKLFAFAFLTHAVAYPSLTC